MSSGNKAKQSVKRGQPLESSFEQPEQVEYGSAANRKTVKLSPKYHAWCQRPESLENSSMGDT